jgi:AcrR family transcriptional regulator
LLAERGLDGMTTNHVAQRAGVSIGSLYRYFPSKEAIVAEINLRHRRVAGDQLIATFDGLDRDFEGTVRAALREFVDLRGSRASVRLSMMRDVPIAWIHKGSAEVWSSVIDATTTALRQIRPSLDDREARLRVFTALHAIQGVTMGLVLWPINAVGSDDVIVLLARLVTAMLLA